MAIFSPYSSNNTVFSSIFLFFFGGDFLINLYLKGEGSADDAALSFAAGRSYLNVMLIGLLPASLVQCYSSTLREEGKTMPPMIAGLIAVVVNLVFNYIISGYNNVNFKTWFAVMFCNTRNVGEQ